MSSAMVVPDWALGDRFIAAIAAHGIRPCFSGVDFSNEATKIGQLFTDGEYRLPMTVTVAFLKDDFGRAINWFVEEFRDAKEAAGGDRWLDVEDQWEGTTKAGHRVFGIYDLGYGLKGHVTNDGMTGSEEWRLDGTHERDSGLDLIKKAKQ